MLRLALVITALAVMMSLALPAAGATTYYGPSFISPASIAPGSTINMVVTTASGSTWTTLPQGSAHSSFPFPGCTYDSNTNTWACSFPQQSCTSSSNFYYSIHEITVTDPNNNVFMLGSATTSGLYWPASLGGSGSGTHVPPQADALNVTIGDSFTIPFGTGAGGFSFTSLLGNPPNDVSPAGPYYWWTVAGSAYGSNLRLDQHPSIVPTSIHGTYQVDIEGVIVCGSSSSSATIQLFFDDGFNVTTPEFGTSVVAVVGVAFILLVLARQGILGKRVKVLPSLR